MYEFEKEKEEPVNEQSISNWPEMLVRIVGIILLLVGLWASILVLLEALSLYRDPPGIEQLAEAIERGSNLDRNLAQNLIKDEVEAAGNAGAATLNSQQAGQGVRLSYFVAWIIALLLLMLVVMIAFSCLRTGSELVLQDRQLKRYMSLLIRELKKPQMPGK